MPKIIGNDKWVLIEQKIDFYMEQCAEQLSVDPRAYAFRISIEPFLELAKAVLSKEQMACYDKQIMENRISNLEAKYKDIDRALGEKVSKKTKGEKQDENH